MGKVVFLWESCSDLRQLHAHEHSGHKEAEEDADEPDEEQQEAVEFGNVWCIGAVQDDKAQTSHSEEETGGQTFHDVLTIYPAKQMVMHYLRFPRSQGVESLKCVISSCPVCHTCKPKRQLAADVHAHQSLNPHLVVQQ